MLSNAGRDGLFAVDFAGRRDVLRPGAFQDCLGPFHLVRCVRVNGEQNSSILNSAFISFGLVFGNADPNQRPSETTDRAADARSRQCSHNRSGSDKWPKAGNRQGSDTYEPSQSPTQNCPRSGAGGSTFGRFRAFSWAKAFVPSFCGNKTEMSLLEKPAAFQSIDAVFHTCVVRVDYCCMLA
jgi:hypothetical protein